MEDEQTLTVFKFYIFSLRFIVFAENCIKDLNTAVRKVELSLSALNKYFNLTLFTDVTVSVVS